MQRNPDAVAFGQHADQTPVLIEYGRTGYVAADELLRGPQDFHVRPQRDDLGRHVILDQR
jgi:hypothetical protein